MSEKKKCDLTQECQSCGQANNCSEEEKQAHREKMVREKLSHIEHKLMIMSGKGGVNNASIRWNWAHGNGTY